MNGLLTQEAAALTARPVTVLGQYKLFATLGQGGMANVYLAAAEGVPGVRKLSVVKCLRPALADDPRVVEMFLDEARLAVRLHHPNIVQTFGAGECDGTYFIAMEYLEGQPLKKLAKLQEGSRELLAERLWLYVVSEVLAGLDYAHNLTDYDGRPLGIVHRDISPQNIFLTYLGHVQLLDFGIAKAALNTTKTEEGVFKGKAHYMAPEQVLSENGIDRRADVFSAGVVLWELLTARRLFQGDVTAVLGALVAKPIPRVSSIIPNIDPRLDAIVARALEKDPDARYQTASEMRLDIEVYLHATNAGVGQRDIERLLLSLYSDQREARAAELHGVMHRLDRRTNSTGLETLRPLQTASRPGTGVRKGDGFGDLPELVTGASRPGSRSRPKGRTEGGPARNDLAADLAELAATDARTGAFERAPAAQGRGWLIVAVVLATIAALIGWLR